METLEEETSGSNSIKKSQPDMNNVNNLLCLLLYIYIISGKYHKVKHKRGAELSTIQQNKATQTGSLLGRGSDRVTTCLKLPS